MRDLPRLRNGLGSFLVLLAVFLGMIALLTVQGGPPSDQPLLPTAPPQPAVIELFPDVDAEDIQAIELLDPYNQQSILLVRSAEGVWFAPDSPDRVVDQALAATVARTLDVLPVVRSFAPEPGADMNQYGFRQDGLYFLAVLFRTVDEVDHIIAVGNPSAPELGAEPGFYALVDDNPAVYLLDSDAVGYLGSVLQTSVFAN